MSNSDKLYNRKRQDRAFTLSVIALVGFFIPIIGLLIALIALGINASIDTADKRTRDRKSRINTIAIIAVVLSLLAGFGWYKFYDDQLTQARNKADSDRFFQENNLRAQQAQKKAALDGCLADADKWWNDNFAGKYYSYQQQAIYLQQHESMKNDCFKRFPQS